MTTREILNNAQKEKQSIAVLNSEIKNNALNKMAEALINNSTAILKANAEDLAAAKGTVSDVMLDRLRLTEPRIRDMANGIISVAKLQDPVGRVISETTRKNGLSIQKVSAPIGVVAIIYESRPNVTSDAAALCFKSGNVCVLRGGKEAYRTSKAIVDAMRGALRECALQENLIQLIEDTTRGSATELMQAVGFVDLLIPRGGKGLINACVNNAKVPCIQTGTGICHIYVDETANVQMALDIIDNAKTSRPSVCNAAEVCLVHKNIANEFLPMLKDRLVKQRINDEKQPVELRLCELSAKIIDGNSANNDDFDTEFLDYILAIKVVDDVNEAISHILKHSTGHSEAIITNSAKNANDFVKGTDSAAVYINASTRFTDGGEFGLGCEMGISTQKLHARGPMGLSELNTYKYVVRGNGQIR